MVLGVNIVPAGATEAGAGEAAASPVVTGAAVNFEADGAVISAGNAYSATGTSIKLGAAATDGAAGVQIVNPFVGDKKLTDETLGNALVRTAGEDGDNNFFIYRYPNTSTAFLIDSAQDKYYVAPFLSVEDAQTAASEGSVRIVESLDELTYTTRAAAGSHLKSEDMNFDPTNDATAATKIYAARKDKLPGEVKGLVLYKDADGSYIEKKNGDKFVVKTIAEALADGTIKQEAVDKINSASTPEKTYTHVCDWVIGEEEQAMQNWDPNNYKPVIMNLAQANGTGTSSTAVNVVEPTWENGVSISMSVKASSEVPTPIFVFSNTNSDYAGNGAYGGLAFYTDGTFVFTEDDAGGVNGAKQNRYGATYLNDFTPINNIGEWVDVTLTIKNDEIKVYYNGQECEPRMNYTNKDSDNKYFNYSYGFVEADRTKICLLQGSRHSQRLYTITKNGIENFTKENCLDDGITLEQYFAAKEGMGFYKYYDSNGVNTHSIMEYITDADCKLFIGGDDGKGFNNIICYSEYAKGKYNLSSRYLSYVYISKKNNSSTTSNWLKLSENEDVAKDMEIKNVVFNDSLKTATDIELDYLSSIIKTNDVPADESTDATSVASYDYTLDEDEKATGVAALNDDLNDSSFSKDDFNNTTIVLGATTGDDSPKGVQLNNPYAGKGALVETIKTAVDRTGLTLDAWVYENGGIKVADKYAKADAVVFYNSTRKENEPQFVRKEIEAYANNTVTNKAIKLVGDEGNYTTEVAAEIATQSVADVILTNARAVAGTVKGDMDKNFWKNYINASYTNEQIIGWSMGNITSAKQCEGALGKTFDGATPAKNVGEWVYVTIKVKNDNIEVYYNGEKATKTMNKAQKDSSYFNYGTGYASDNTAARIATMVKENSYAGLLSKFTEEENWSDTSKYNYCNGKAVGVENIMKFLTSSDTKLYLGGASNQAKYEDINEGMEFGTISFYDVLVTDETIADQYTAAKELRETSKAGNVTDDSGDVSGDSGNVSGDSGNVSGDPVNPSGTPVEPSGTPVKPSDKPVEPSGTPVKPSDKPVDPLDANFKAGDADCSKKVDLNDAKYTLKDALGIKFTIKK